MTDKTIDQFFTPARLVKRPKPSDSPDGMDTGSEKVGDLTRGELMDCIGRLMEGLLDKKLSSLATKADLVELSGKVEVLTAENEALQQEIGALKLQGRVVMAKLRDLEGQSRRNNLVFWGLRWNPKTTNFCLLIKGFCEEMFGNGEVFVNRAHPLGKDSDAIIAHLPCDSDIDYIMSRVKNLKGTNYVVHRDYPQEIREKRAMLAAVRAEVERVSGRRRMTLVFDHLTIEGRRFIWEENKLLAGRIDGAKELQDITKCDFTAFLENLARDGPPKRQQHQQSYAEAAATDPLPSSPPINNGDPRTSINITQAVG